MVFLPRKKNRHVDSTSAPRDPRLQRQRDANPSFGRRDPVKGGNKKVEKHAMISEVKETTDQRHVWANCSKQTIRH